jgi:uncharacterized protein YciI
MKRFIYFYKLKPEPEQVRTVATKHVSYWEGLEGREVRGGTFDKLTGGLMCFDAKDRKEARAIVEEDPFFLHDLFLEFNILEWSVTSP